jgi:adenylate cyclase, class 2
VITDTRQNPPIETEIKLRIPSVKKIRDNISVLRFESIQPRTFERNIVFDTPDQSLKKSKRLLRLRNNDGQFILTFKRPITAVNSNLLPADAKNYKVREEIEVDVSDFQKTQTIIQLLGFDIFFIYEKYREVFRGKSKTDFVKIMLDETPIGNFIEIEGETENIDHTAQLLGYSRQDYITANYHSLFKQAGLTGHMQFQ